MNTFRRSLLLATSVTALMSHAASADVIDNGTIQLGINPAGNLVDGDIGLNFLNTTASSGEALAPGCACEGWGIADMSTGAFGQAGETFGFDNIVSSTLTVSGTGTDAASDGSAAVSVTDVADGAMSLRVTHDFTPSSSEYLYRANVMVENTGADDVDELVYRRTMDWDIPPTEFSEFVTIGGWPASALVGSSDDGFVAGNPNVPLTTIASDAVLNGNFTDSGPNDHGAAFDFSFGELVAGDSQDFDIFYGAAPSEADAMVALGDVGAEVFSLGQPSSEDGETLGTPHTFMFGFAGVGGTPLPPGGGGAASVPLNFGTQLASVVVDHHLYRSAQRLDQLSLGTAGSMMSSQGDDITPVGISGMTFRLTGSYFDGDFDPTTNNVGLTYDSKYAGLSVEREFTPGGGTFKNGMIGFAFGYENVSASRTDGLGSFDLKGKSYAIYGGVADPTGAFFDGALFYTDLDYNQRRIGMTQTFNSAPQGDSVGGRVRAGYNFDLSGPAGAAMASRTLGAYVEWTHRNTTIDGYTEDNRGLTTDTFSDTSNDIGLGMRYAFAGDGKANKLTGIVDVALVKDVSGGDFSATQTTFGGTSLTRTIDSNRNVTLRSSVQLSVADFNGWGGSARVGSRINSDHSEVEVGLELSRRF